MPEAIPYIEKRIVPALKPLEIQKKEDYKQRVYWLIIILFLVRLFLASIIELGNDEAYYWLYTQRLQWNYFDHPPLVALWGRVFTFDLALEEYEVFVRLGSIISCAFATFFIFKSISSLHSEKAGWYGALLYNTSFYAGIVSGLFIMPDSPQMFFWTFCLWMLARIGKNEANWWSWIAFGIAAGLCILSKVHGVFLWTGLGLYVFFQKREWLLRPQFYIALLLTVIIISPILFWNMHHDFITYRFHSQRVTINERSINYKNFLTELGGQIFLNNPVNVALIVVAIIAFISKPKHHPSYLSVFLFIGLPLAFILLFVSLFRTTLPHWSGPAYVTLLPVAAIYIAEVKKRQHYPTWLRCSCVAFVIFLICWPLLIHFYPGTWGSKKGTEVGKGDVTLDRFGWKAAGKEFALFYKEEVNKKRVAINTPVICNTWWGAHVEYYFCRPQKVTMIGLGSTQEIHHYQWLNSSRKEGVHFDNAYCIVPSDEFYDARKHYSTYYKNIELAKVIEVTRSNTMARKFYIYRLSGWKNKLPEIKKSVDH